jgi:selenocysteine-specific elongation factor
LRDPGRHHVAGGVTLLDVAPPRLTRRGAAATRAHVLAALDGRPDEHAELARRGVMRRPDLKRMGVAVTCAPVAGDWLADPSSWSRLRSQLPQVVAAWLRDHPLEPGPTVEVVRRALELPDRSLVHALVRPPLVVRDGRVCDSDARTWLPEPVAGAIRRLTGELADAPFAAPEAARLAELGLGPRELAAAVRAGALVRVSDAVVLPPGSVAQAADVLGELAQPFTVSQARLALGTTRRVAVPLLELLDRRGITQRLSDDRRLLRRP